MNIKVLKAYMSMMEIYNNYNYSIKGLKKFNEYIKKYNITIK